MEGRERGGFWSRIRDSFVREFRKNYLEEKPRQIVKNILLVILGNILLAVSSAFFIIPTDLVSGGVSGLAIVVDEIVTAAGGSTDFMGGINTLVTIFTVFFFLLGIFIVGWDFTMKTAISTLIYPAFLWIFQAVRDISWMDWIRVENYTIGAYETIDYGILAIIGLFGGILMGMGVALAFRGGGSTGGTDCLVIAISRRTKIKANNVSVAIDTVIILVGIFLSRDLIDGLIGILAAGTCAVMISWFFVGSQHSYTATIISPRWKEISDAINSEMVRGTTIYPAKGGYTGDIKQVVSVTFNDREYPDLARIIHRYDPHAFLTVSETHDVRGLGFTWEDEDAMEREKEEEISELSKEKSVRKDREEDIEQVEGRTEVSDSLDEEDSTDL